VIYHSFQANLVRKNGMRDLSFVSGEPCTKKPAKRSTRRTWYEKRLFSGVQGEPCTKNFEVK